MTNLHVNTEAANEYGDTKGYFNTDQRSTKYYGTGMPNSKI